MAFVYYKFVITGFPDPNNSKLVIDNSDPRQIYNYTEFSIDYDIVEPLTNTANVVVQTKGIQNVGTISQDFAEGNIVELYVNEKRKYVGFIASYTLTVSRDTGTLIILNLKSLLMSLNQQMVVNSYQDDVVLGGNTTITDFASNKIKFQNVLDWFTSESIIGYAAINVLNFQPTINNVLGLPYIFSNGSENTLTDQSLIWFYASVNDNRLDALQKVLQPYQRLIYQDPSGVLKIEPMTSEPYQDSTTGFTYYIDLVTNERLPTPFIGASNYGNVLWSTFSYQKAAANVANRAYSMLMQVGLNIAPSGPGSSSFVSVSTAQTSNNLFPRPVELLNSGYFEQSVNYSCDLSTKMITDPTLLTYFAQNNNAGLTAALAGNVGGQQGQVTKIYAQLAMARALFEESQLQITIPYEEYADYDLPLGRTISVQEPTLLDTGSWYCYGCSLSFSQGTGSLLTLQLTKPYTYNAYWTSELFTS